MRSLAPLRWPLLTGSSLVLLAVAGMWLSVLRAERQLRRSADAALAWQASAYLRVVTPLGAGGRFDAARLLSSSNALADASFWPGGLQVVLGSTALVPDTIGLLPLPAAVQAVVEASTVVVHTDHGKRPVALVPFRSKDQALRLGWVGVWDTLGPRVLSVHALLLSLLALGALPFALLAFLQEHDRRYRLVTLGVAVGLLAALALDLGLSVRFSATESTDTRLLIARRLVEIAATGMGVRQATLPEIAVGLRVRKLDGTVDTVQDVVRVQGDSGEIARIVAATPRTQDGLELGLRPVESGLGGLWAGLGCWMLLGAVGLGYSAWSIQQHVD